MAVEMPSDLPRPSLGWKFWLRIVVSAVLLAVLVSKAPDLDGILPKRHHLLTVLLLAAAVLMTLLGVVLSAWRWQRVLCIFDVSVRLRPLVSHYLAGLFVGNVLPSTIGGDVVRVTRSAGTIGSSSVAFASVVLERLTGFVALPLLVLAGFVWKPSLLDLERTWIALLIAWVTLFTLAVLLFIAGHPRIAGRFAERQTWTRFIGAIHLGVDRLRREPRKALPVLGTALVYQVSVVLSVALLFRTLDLPVPLAGVFLVVPAVAMLQVLPISLNGLGVREWALVLFLEPFGVKEGQAIAAGLLWFSAMLAVSVLGAPAIATGNRHRFHASTPTPASAAEDATS